MLKCAPTGFLDFLEFVVTRLVECFKSTEDEMSHTAELTLEQLVTTLDAQRCVRVLLPMVMVEEGAALQCSIHLLSKALPRLPSAVLLEQLPAVIPGLTEAFRNPSADIRKAVVFTLVEIFVVLGEALWPYLNELNAAQLKLVTIYVNRTMAQRGLQGQPAVSGV
jgi:CLIP-associating protein 1/2